MSRTRAEVAATRCRNRNLCDKKGGSAVGVNRKLPTCTLFRFRSSELTGRLLASQYTDAHLGGMIIGEPFDRIIRRAK